MKHASRSFSLLLLSFALAAILLLLGGLKEKETTDIINLVITLSVTIAGFGLVAFQISSGASNELKNDFLDSSLLMILSTISGFFFLVYPDDHFFSINFGEAAIFLFFWAFIFFFIVLIDRRFKVCK